MQPAVRAAELSRVIQEQFFFLSDFSRAAGALSVGRKVKCYLLHLSQALGSTWG